MEDRKIYIYQPNDFSWETKIKADELLFGYRCAITPHVDSEKAQETCINIMQNVLAMADDIGPIKVRENIDQGKLPLTPDLMETPKNGKLYEVIYY